VTKSIADIKNSKIIAVIGQGKGCPEDIALLAEEVGFEIAKHGGILLCGGLDGVMNASCKGAKRAGGMTIGILPGEHKSESNPFVDIPIVTGMSVARNVIIARTADAIIAVGGKFGTLSEIAYGLSFGKAIVGLKTWELEAGIISAASPVEAVRSAFSMMQ